MRFLGRTPNTKGTAATHVSRCTCATSRHIREWEHVEIARSAQEAAHTTTAGLRADERQVERYLDPPGATCFPLEYAYHLLGNVRGKSVLDLGCGSGENSLLLVRRGAKVVGIDISESLIRLAELRLAVNGLPRGAKFLVSSAHDLALANESVDIVFGIGILHHLELPLVAREVKRVIKPSGRAIFQEPVRNSKLIWFIRQLIPYRAPDVSPFERPLTDGELREFAAGFTRYRTRAFRLPYMGLAELLPVVRDHVHPLFRLDDAILKTFPRLKYYASVRVIEVAR